jgi:hypothetical protein
MKKCFNYISASTKVFCDKAFDYASYYIGYTADESDDSDSDIIQDYDGILKIELYEDENNSTRIYPASSYYNEYKTFYGEPTHVIDNIYLGSAFNAATYDTLKKFDIKVIMNATTEISNYYPKEFTYIRYQLYDNNKHSIKKYLEKSFNDIQLHQQQTQGNILIHCFMGASRSASIVLYYLMKTQKHSDGKPFSFDDAVTYLKEKRITVNPTFRLTKDLASSVVPPKN